MEISNTTLSNQNLSVNFSGENKIETKGPKPARRTTAPLPRTLRARVKGVRIALDPQARDSFRATNGVSSLRNAVALATGEVHTDAKAAAQRAAEIVQSGLLQLRQDVPAALSETSLTKRQSQLEARKLNLKAESAEIAQQLAAAKEILNTPLATPSQRASAKQARQQVLETLATGTSKIIIGEPSRAQKQKRTDAATKVQQLEARQKQIDALIPKIEKREVQLATLLGNARTQFEQQKAKSAKVQNAYAEFKNQAEQTALELLQSQHQSLVTKHNEQTQLREAALAQQAAYEADPAHKYDFPRRTFVIPEVTVQVTKSAPNAQDVQAIMSQYLPDSLPLPTPQLHVKHPSLKVLPGIEALSRDVQAIAALPEKLLSQLVVAFAPKPDKKPVLNRLTATLRQRNAVTIALMADRDNLAAVHTAGQLSNERISRRIQSITGVNPLTVKLGTPLALNQIVKMDEADRTHLVTGYANDIQRKLRGCKTDAERTALWAKEAKSYGLAGKVEVFTQFVNANSTLKFIDAAPYRPWAERVSKRLNASQYAQLPAVAKQVAKEMTQAGVHVTPSDVEDLYNAVTGNCLTVAELPRYKYAFDTKPFAKPDEKLTSSQRLAVLRADLKAREDATGLPLTSLIPSPEEILTRTRGVARNNRLSVGTEAAVAAEKLGVPLVKFNLASGFIREANEIEDKQIAEANAKATKEQAEAKAKVDAENRKKTAKAKIDAHTEAMRRSPLQDRVGLFEDFLKSHTDRLLTDDYFRANVVTLEAKARPDAIKQLREAEKAKVALAINYLRDPAGLRNAINGTTPAQRLELAKAEAKRLQAETGLPFDTLNLAPVLIQAATTNSNVLPGENSQSVLAEPNVFRVKSAAPRNHAEEYKKRQLEQELKLANEAARIASQAAVLDAGKVNEALDAEAKVLSLREKLSQLETLAAQRPLSVRARINQKLQGPEKILKTERRQLVNQATIKREEILKDLHVTTEVNDALAKVSGKTADRHASFESAQYRLNLAKEEVIAKARAIYKGVLPQIAQHQATTAPLRKTLAAAQRHAAAVQDYLVDRAVITWLNAPGTKQTLGKRDAQLKKLTGLSPEQLRSIGILNGNPLTALVPWAESLDARRDALRGRHTEPVGINRRMLTPDAAEFARRGINITPLQLFILANDVLDKSKKPRNIPAAKTVSEESIAVSSAPANIFANYEPPASDLPATPTAAKVVDLKQVAEQHGTAIRTFERDRALLLALKPAGYEGTVTRLTRQLERQTGANVTALRGAQLLAPQAEAPEATLKKWALGHSTRNPEFEPGMDLSNVKGRPRKQLLDTMSEYVTDLAQRGIHVTDAQLLKLWAKVSN